jgi:hypothetical protein
VSPVMAPQKSARWDALPVRVMHGVLQGLQHRHARTDFEHLRKLPEASGEGQGLMIARTDVRGDDGCGEAPRACVFPRAHLWRAACLAALNPP